MSAHRANLVSILIAGFVALFFLSRLDEVQRAGFEWTPGVLAIVVILAGIAQNRLAWATSFVVAVVASGFGWAIASTRLDEPAHATIAAVGTVIALALWGLKPVDEPIAPPPDQG
jgi:hypothetical protein